MDREISLEERKRRLIRRTATVVVAIAAVVFSVAATMNWLRPSVRRRDIQTARVERGTVYATLEASGTVVPAIETVISSPIEARVLRINHRPGDALKTGDEILTLDTSATRLDAGRLSDELAQKESELARRRLQVDEDLTNLRSQLEQKQLDGEILRYKAEQNAKLHAAGLVAAQEDLAAATAAKKNEIELVQLRQAVLRAERKGAAEIAAAELEVRTARNQRDESQHQLQLSMTRSDRDGVLTWVVPEVGATARRGDVIARVADLSAFRVVATIADMHASKLAAGGPARIRLDDQTVIDGTISSVEPRIENGVAKFYVELEQPSHPKLRNQLRVTVLALTGRRDHVLQIHRGAIGEAERDSVFVIHDGVAVRIPVQFGVVGEDNVEIVAGLREGDEVVISNMTDYQGVKQLVLK